MCFSLFSFENKNLKAFSNIDNVQNKINLENDNKLLNFISTKSTVKPKIIRNTSAKNIKKKTRNYFETLAHKSIGFSPIVSKEIVKKASVSKS